MLAWLDGQELISPKTLTPIRRAIEDEVKLPKEEVEIDLWLESPGGDANAAYKLALMLRNVAGCVRVVVPDYAKSAATLLALAGDKIFLAPGAELGPLDAQMPEEGSFSGSISALNIARAADEVAREAVAVAVAGGADLLQVTGLSRAQTLEAMLKFSASFSEPLVRQLDPKLVHHAKQMLRVTARYAERLLTMSDCSNADRVAQRLVENFPTHGFVIDLEEARDLGLPVRPMQDYDLLPLATAYHRAAEDGQPIIEFGLLSEFVPDEPSNDDQHQDQHAETSERGTTSDAQTNGAHGEEGAEGRRSDAEAVTDGPG